MSEGEPLALTEKELLLQAQLNEQRLKIAGKKARQQFLENEMSKYPSKQELEVQEAAAARVQQEREEKFKEAERRLEGLRETEERVISIAARVHRLENFCTRSEMWISDTLTKDVAAQIAKEEMESEKQIAAVIQELLLKREEQLAVIHTLKDRVSTRAAAIRRGYHKDPTKKIEGFEYINTEQFDANERNISPRVKHDDCIDEETYDLITFNSQVGGQLETLHAKIRRLTAARGRLQTECLHHRHETKREEALLVNAIRQTNLQISRDTRFSQQLNSTNASLVSTLQLLMSQLNVEHYGVLGGPLGIEVAGRQEQDQAKNRALYRITDGA